MMKKSVVHKNLNRFLAQKKPLFLFVFVLILLVLSSVVVAEDTTSEDSCGFWCSVNEFLWGSSEARAGKGWFDI